MLILQQVIDAGELAKKGLKNLEAYVWKHYHSVCEMRMFSVNDCRLFGQHTGSELLLIRKTNKLLLGCRQKSYNTLGQNQRKNAAFYFPCCADSSTQKRTEGMSHNNGCAS